MVMVICTSCRGVACLKFDVRNCGDVVNAFIEKNYEHLKKGVDPERGVSALFAM